MYNHLELTSNLAPSLDYSLFKEGISPDWKDCRNTPGGRWIISSDRRQRTESLNGYWCEILLLLIGADLPDKEVEQVNGAVVTKRVKGDKLAMWLVDCRDMNTVTNIKKRIKGRLGISTENTIQFKIHSEEQARSIPPKLFL